MVKRIGEVHTSTAYYATPHGLKRRSNSHAPISRFTGLGGKIAPVSQNEINSLQDLHVDQLVDTNPEETAEWHQSLDSLVKFAGPARARYLMLSLFKHAHEKNIDLPNLRVTDYMNTIPPEKEPKFPGDEFLERRIRAYIRWNAAIMVHRAQRPGVGVGGHISTFASSAALYEVGFNHFFKGKEMIKTNFIQSS